MLIPIFFGLHRRCFCLHQRAGMPDRARGTLPGDARKIALAHWPAFETDVLKSVDTKKERGGCQC